MSQPDDTEPGAAGVLGATVGNPFVTNPYHGHIFPGMMNGSKLYLAATKLLEESKKVELFIKNAIAIKSIRIQASNNFGWDKCIVIQTTWDSNDNPKTFSNLLLNPEKCGMDTVKFHGAYIFRNPNYATSVIPNMEIKSINPQENVDDQPCFQL